MHSILMGFIFAVFYILGTESNKRKDEWGPWIILGLSSGLAFVGAWIIDASY